MLKFIRNVASRVLGSIVGMITGIAAGFIPGYYFCLDSPGALADSGLPGLAYIASLPFCILWHMVRGTFEGATKGLTAALVYPNTLNNEYQTNKNNDKFYNSLSIYLSSSYHSPLLTEFQEAAFRSRLKEQSEEIQKVLNSDYEEYKKFIDQKKCAITQKPFKDLRKPLIIIVNNDFLICEGAALKQRVAKCCNEQTPVFIDDEYNKVKHIINAENVYPFTKDFKSDGLGMSDKLAKFDKIVSFIKQVKKLLSPTFTSTKRILLCKNPDLEYQNVAPAEVKTNDRSVIPKEVGIQEQSNTQSNPLVKSNVQVTSIVPEESPKIRSTI